MRILIRLQSAFVPALLVTGLAATGCSGGDQAMTASGGPGWRDASINAVSKPTIGAGVVAVAALRPDGTLQTVVDDVATGRRLWTQPATMHGRPGGMGVAPPAMAAERGRPLVANVEPRGQGIALTARDAHTGRPKWSRPVRATFGPVGCDRTLCLSETTTKGKARFSVLDGGTGRAKWHIPGPADVETVDAHRVVLFRMTGRPALESRDLDSGRRIWRLPVEKAVGRGVELSGGWSFGVPGERVDASRGDLVGYIGPYQKGGKGALSAFGFFSVQLADGRLRWTRPRLLRVFPSASPAVAMIAREVTSQNRYGGFARVDPRTGRTTTQIPVTGEFSDDWLLAFTPDLSRMGFIAHGKEGRTYDLTSGRAVTGRVRTWSFCSMSPSPLKIKGQRGFYPVAALCPYDVKKGKRVTATTAPPAWYTGSVDGWRAWSDQSGALHGVHDARGTSPGMYT